MSSAAYIGLLKLVAVMLLVSYLGLVIFALVFTNRLIFPAPPPGYRHSADLIKLPFNKRGETVTLIHLDNPGSRFLIFYHHGNGEDLQGILPRLEMLRKAGFAVLAWDYPGYGTSEGKPSEKSIFQAADRVWNAIPELTGYAPDNVIHYGRSIGGGPAVLLSSRYKPAGLIMEGVFTSIYRTGLPARILPWDHFDNLSRIGDINCPVLFMHGVDDRIVPFRQARQLFDMAPQPKFFTWFEGAGHNNLVEEYPDIHYSSLARFRDFLENPEQDP